MYSCQHADRNSRYSHEGQQNGSQSLPSDELPHAEGDDGRSCKRKKP